MKNFYPRNKQTLFSKIMECNIYDFNSYKLRKLIKENKKLESEDSIYIKKEIIMEKVKCECCGELFEMDDLVQQTVQGPDYREELLVCEKCFNENLGEE